MSGAGDDIYGDRNNFQYLYTSVEGPVRIRARLLEMDRHNPYSKAGIMVRNSLSDDSAHGYVGRTPDHGTEVLWSPATREPTTSQQLGDVGVSPDWLELVYDDDQVIVSISTDGESWQPIDQRPVSLSGTIYVGLAVCSVVPRTLCTAQFEGVQIAELPGRTEQPADFVQ